MPLSAIGDDMRMTDIGGAGSYVTGQMGNANKTGKSVTNALGESRKQHFKAGAASPAAKAVAGAVAKAVIP